MQEFEPFCRQLTNEGIGTRQVAARPGQAGDKTELDRVFGDVEDDGDSGGYGLSRQCGRGIGGDDHDDLSPNQFGRQRREPVKPTFGPPVFDRHVLALDIACVLQTLANPRTRFTIASGDWLLRNPITGVALCCARAASGHGAAPPKNAMFASRGHSITPSARAIGASLSRELGLVARAAATIFIFLYLGSAVTSAPIQSGSINFWSASVSSISASTMPSKSPS